MPNLLSRNPFHHHHHGSKTSNASDGSSHHGERSENSPTSPPTPIKSSKSFLNFIHRGHSNDSIRSEKSTESHHGRPHHLVNSHDSHNYTSSPATPKTSHSMSELKRFFRPSLPKKKSGLSGQSTKPSASHIAMSPYAKPGRTREKDHHSHTQSAIPPSSDSTLSLSNKINIYHDDTILAQKYGKLGKLLGSGAGGSVKILTRPSDGATFAVKEFRPRKPNESVKEYAKKCTAEFLIGSTLHNPYIIETLDIFSDSKQNKYYEVMEYCPIDFFAVVMTGKMTRNEINCCIKQISTGVKFLHSKGLAHRDLKLDNCVMTSSGIVKLIDFGSAVVFKYPFEDNITMAHGIVGSDPYLAPEVITSTKSYDPQFVDVWSIAIIFCCLMLKRFPWKAPRKDTDENFRYFCMPDDMEHDYVASAKHNEMIIKERLKRKHERDLQISNQKEEAKPFASSNLKNNTNANNDNDNEIDSSKVPDKGSDKLNEINNNRNDNNDTKYTESDSINNKTNKTVPTNEDTVNNKNANNDVKNIKETAGTKNCEVTSQAKVSEPIENDSSKQSASTNNQEPNRASTPKPHRHKGVIHGPYRLLRLLPHASRPILSRMLSVDPATRATMADLFEDEWFANIPCCTLDARKNLIPAPGHHHTLVDEENAHLESYK